MDQMSVNPNICYPHVNRTLSTYEEVVIVTSFVTFFGFITFCLITGHHIEF